MIYLTGVLTEGISVGRPGMKLLLGTCLVSGSHLNLWPSPVPPLPPSSRPQAQRMPLPISLWLLFLAFAAWVTSSFHTYFPSFSTRTLGIEVLYLWDPFTGHAGCLGQVERFSHYRYFVHYCCSRVPQTLCTSVHCFYCCSI